MIHMIDLARTEKYQKPKHQCLRHQFLKEDKTLKAESQNSLDSMLTKPES